MTPERLSKPTAGIDAFGRATISRADLAAIETLRAALGEARALANFDVETITIGSRSYTIRTVDDLRTYLEREVPEPGR